MTQRHLAPAGTLSRPAVQTGNTGSNAVDQAGTRSDLHLRPWAAHVFVRKSRTEQRMLALLNFIDYLKKVNSDQFGKTRTSEFKHIRAE